MVQKEIAEKVTDLGRRSEQNKNDIFALVDLTAETNRNVTRLDTEVSGLRDDVARIGTEVARSSTEVSGLRDEVARIGTEVSGIRDDVMKADRRTDVLDQKVDGVVRMIDDVDLKVGPIGDNVVSMAEWCRGRFDGIDRTLADVLTLLREGKAGA